MGEERIVYERRLNSERFILNEENNDKDIQTTKDKYICNKTTND
jgi:hypothetical protein